MAIALPVPLWAGLHSAGGCASCHNAHNTTAGTLDGLTIPLWSGDLAVGSSFTPYTSITMDATVGDPDGDSLMCLSCHDGTGSGLQPEDDLGTDLTDDHPISFVYDTALSTADGRLEDPATKLVPDLSGTIEAQWLPGGKIQCTTCHDVHNNNIHATPMLREPAATLCSVCHTQ